MLELVDKVENKKFNPKEKIKVDTIKDEQAQIIKELTGKDVSGYDVVIEARQIEHIIKDHGKNGKSDQQCQIILT